MVLFQKYIRQFGQRVGPPDTILEEDHPMTILSKFGSNLATGSRQEDLYVIFLSETICSIRTKC
jgi:hypothetical protein